MNVRILAIAAVALAGAVGTTFAEARDRTDVQFSVSIGQPVIGAWAQPHVVHPVVVGWDRDRDGIPNRHDRVYNPRWDRDGDGVPNRHDRVYNPRWDRDGDGIPNRYDRVYSPRWDRDGDGVPNRHDRYDNRRADRDRDGIPDRFDRRDDRRHPHGR
jgi:hypothetical protein